MKHRHLLLASAIAAATLALAACKKEAAPGTDTASSSAPAGETADQFVARINVGDDLGAMAVLHLYQQ